MASAFGQLFTKTALLNDPPPKRTRRWMPWQLRALSILCQIYTIFMTGFVPVYCIYQSRTLPGTSVFGVTLSTCVACYVSLNLFSNWHYFKQKQLRGVNSASKDYGNCIAHSTKYIVWHCSDCRSYVPEGTHHCPICDVCIKRRDHHCFFLGGCVGSSNLDHFVTFCFHACLGCGYASLLLTQHLRHEYKEISSIADLKYYLPPYATVQWFVGTVSTSHTFGVTLLSMAFTTYLGTMFMASFHLYLVFLDKTSNEFWGREESGGCRRSVRNFNHTLGNQWYLRVLFPPFLFKRNQSDDGSWKFMKLV